MSSSLPGKFQDHYIVLGVEPRADSETIRAAYNKLARKYSPENPETGDDAMFETVSVAYEVLSDPVLRVSFDKLKGIDHDAAHPMFSGAAFFPALRRASLLRAAVLAILCDRRRTKPFQPVLSLRDVESMLQTTSEELSFAMWYLKQRAHVIGDDKNNMQITVDGMDYLERNQPTAELILPLIKPESIAAAPAPPQPAPPPPSATPVTQAQPESSVLKALQRALSRDQSPQEVRVVAPRSKT